MGTAVVVSLLVAALQSAHGQALRLSDDATGEPPDWATFTLGPFHSTGEFGLSAGARWTDGGGRETDFLRGSQRGEITDDGWDVPVIARLSIQNYAQLSRNIDLQMTLTAQYEHYPLDTQEDEFRFNLGEEGISGRIDSEFRLTRNIHGVIYWQPRYQTDYVDERGDSDTLSGTEFEYFESVLGATLTWLFAKGKSISGTAERTDFLPQDDEFDDQEYVEHRFSTRYAQQIIEEVQAGIKLEHRDIDYKVDSRRDSTIDTVELFASGGFADEGRVQLTRNSTLSGSIGYSRAETEDLASDGETGDSGTTSESFIWSVGIDWGEKGRLSKNMTHGLGYSRRIDSRFDADIAIVDTVSYFWTWIAGVWDFNFLSSYELVDPQGGDTSEYSDWSNTLGVNYYLTKYLALNASTTYTIRDNEESNDPLEEGDLDYEEWVSRIGTSYQVSRRTDFTTYFERAERDGDDAGEDFERDTFEAFLTYTYPF